MFLWYREKYMCAGQEVFHMIYLEEDHWSNFEILFLSSSQGEISHVPRLQV